MQRDGRTTNKEHKQPAAEASPRRSKSERCKTGKTATHQDAALHCYTEIDDCLRMILFLLPVDSSSIRFKPTISYFSRTIENIWGIPKIMKSA